MSSHYRNVVYWYQRANRPGWGKWMVKLHARSHFSGREMFSQEQTDADELFEIKQQIAGELRL